MRLNDGRPVWHLSVSVWSGARATINPVPAEAEAVRCLRGVGGPREWWIYNAAARVGHLRVGLSAAEMAVLPPGVAEHDAGDSGPERARRG